MAKQRIRYDKKDGQLVSKYELYSAKGSKYLVFINLETMTYLIRNTLSLRKYEGGKGINNIIVLKRNVKKHLALLGVRFDKEKRSRSFGICPKNWNESLQREKRRKEKLEKEMLDKQEKKD